MTKIEVYCIGYSVKDKEPNSWELEIFPIEVLPNVEGELTEPDEISVQTKNADGDDVAVSIKRHKTIIAHWLPIGQPNRGTAPDVCRGETVMVVRYGTEDRFYWLPMFAEFDLRKKESVLYFFSNKNEPSADGELNKEGYYFLIDTRNKKIKLHTSNNDEEEVEYNITIDTKNGSIEILDSNENRVFLNSKDSELNVKILEKITEETKNKEVTIEEELKETMKNRVVKADENIKMSFKGIEMSNGQFELIDILAEFVQTCIDEQHVGNMGSPTAMFPASTAKFMALKQKIESFKP